MTEWKAQIGGGKFAIQFETDNYDLYKMVEKKCQKAVDKCASVGQPSVLGSNPDPKTEPPHPPASGSNAQKTKF